MPGPQICLEAIPGAGKTELAKKLGEALQLPVYHEPVKTNPYLVDFYKDPKTEAFPMQMYFMIERIKIHEEAQIVGLNHRGSIVDRCIIGDRAFALLHARAGNIKERDWHYCYENWFNYQLGRIRVPQVILFLDVEPSVALERVQRRGREAEKDIPIEYLRSLQKEYYDLLAAIESGSHDWSRGMVVKKWQWNVDYQDITPIVKWLTHEFPSLKEPVNAEIDP